MTKPATDSQGARFTARCGGGPRHHYIQASDIAEEIIEYAGEGNSPEEIAQELGVPVGSVRRVLENRP